ncbi:hypothetical protein TIFTF001_001573 [Ficus carica]|uniref:Uncharacterized protein n=1 Tax=Ficus carica TaxID=3494 RepID=A0AA88CQP0_FICCA|nr:hypothetical protein TIFTF001_001573 [Ficus carica]
MVREGSLRYALLVFGKKPRFKLSALVIGDHLLSGLIESDGKHVLEVVGVHETRSQPSYLPLRTSVRALPPWPSR